MIHASSSAVAAAFAGALAATVTVPYVLGWLGLPLMPAVVGILACAAGAWSATVVSSMPAGDAAPLWAWSAVVGIAGAWLASLSWPLLLPPGGGSDLTHHLLLVDVIERTRHLVDGDVMGGALSEMAHYTPGLHLAIVVLGSLAHVDPWRAAHPLVIATVALKAGFVFLIAHRALAGARTRLPLAFASVLLVLFVPRAYSLGGFLQSGYLAQVAAELFVLAGWWALMAWQASPNTGRMALVGVYGAATFLVWPIWIGPLLLAAAATVLLHDGLTTSARIRAAPAALAPAALVAAMHLSRHAAWLELAGTSGAVPAFVPDLAWWGLAAAAIAGLAASWRALDARVTLWLAAAIAVQAAALVVLARGRGAGTAYMAVKMTYLGAYPLAVLAALGVARAVAMLPSRVEFAAGVACAAAVAVVASRLAAGFAVAPPVASPDLYSAGVWARANLAPACVDYVVKDGDTAYWLHLAVMGQPRASQRTAELDRYSGNAAVGRWIDGTNLLYAVADATMLPAEVRAVTREVHRDGTAVVIARAPRDGDPICTR